MANISIIIPVYQVEKYLRRCLDSVIGQTYKDFDVVLVDDGSTDGSGEICNEYAAKDIRINVIHQDNKGLSAARNTGIEWSFTKSNSDWITFIDSDDWVCPQYLEALFGGKFVTKEQTRDMVDYMFAGTKRNIESCPFASQEEKDAEIHRRELLLNALKPLMGL